jgi:hypothetical protein
MKLVLRKKHNKNKDNNKAVDYPNDSLQKNGTATVEDSPIKENSSNDRESVDAELINKKLPKELLIRIFSFLNVISVSRCAQVSKVIGRNRSIILINFDSNGTEMMFKSILHFNITSRTDRLRSLFKIDEKLLSWPENSIIF